MAADSTEIVDRTLRLDEGFLALRQMVTGPAAATLSVASMELRVFREVLAMGRRLLELFFLTRAASRPEAPTTVDGTPMTECRQRPTTYLSVFGKITFQRHRFFASGQAGVSPLDAELSMPERCYSPLLRDWAGSEVVDSAYDASARTLERILGLNLAKSAFETLVQEDATDVDAFYTQKPVPAAAQEGPILVVQADGAGVRLVGTEPSERTGHQTSKREAVVTAIYSIHPHVRTPQDVAAALLRDADQDNAPKLRVVRPEPIGKETRATLDGKAPAFARLLERVDSRDGPQTQDRVALTDGADAYRNWMTATFPSCTLVLDIMHVLTYLWPAAKALHGNWISDKCRAYVRCQLEALLAGQVQTVIEDMTTRLDRPRRCPAIGASRWSAPSVTTPTMLTPCSTTCTWLAVGPSPAASSRALASMSSAAASIAPA